MSTVVDLFRELAATPDLPGAACVIERRHLRRLHRLASRLLRLPGRDPGLCQLSRASRMLAVVSVAAQAQTAIRGDRRSDPAGAVLTHPIAPVRAMRTNGHHVNQVTVSCPFCRGQHVHEWFGEPDGLRMPTCGAHTSYAISIGTRERIEAMRTEYPVPDGVVGLVPLHLSYAYERDGDDDVVGVVVDTTLGGFVLWL